MMAMRLGITPTFHLSCRLRLLRLESLVSHLRSVGHPGLCSSSSNSPRLGFWRAIASNDQGSNPPSQQKRYDLSSGFLQSAGPRESRNYVEEEEDWERPAANYKARDSKPSSDDDDSDGEYRRQPRGSRREEEGDDEVGDWMGTAEPSKKFRSSSLYSDVRSARYSPLPPPDSKPRRARKAKPQKQQEYASPPPPQDVFDDGATTFVPAVIKPEQPYIYSYSETPKVAPLGFREKVYSPFGPEGVSRPWTGRPPLAKSKKAPREFDSFNPPPQGKKGVKPVQQPGPFPEGEGPQLGRSREQIMGAPLSDGEVKELVARAQKEDRQLNLGRDGLTHNMLDLIHQHWKRRRVCKIKCKGVPTVDMDNVCNVLEEKTGGKIILRAGGVVYLFRGRNYNYKTRPIIPLMLWKPPAPIYPKLIEKAPAGLTVEEANDLRRLGRTLAPICHLGKNGVYLNLVRDVQSAFRADDLVKVDCKRMNPSDYKKIGAKLKDLVPCVLLSFEHESILMWKGPKSVQGEKPDGVDNNAGEEAVSPFRQELSEDGQELLEQTLTSQDDNETSASADNDSEEEEAINQYGTDTESDESVYQSDEEEDDAEVESSYDDRDESEDEADIDPAAAERAERAVAEFESLWEEALSSSAALELDEEQVEDPDAVFEVVKREFGGPAGAPAQARNKRNSNELVGKKALRQPRLDPSVLDRVPKDPSGLLEIDELAKLLAP